MSKQETKQILDAINGINASVKALENRVNAIEKGTKVQETSAKISTKKTTKGTWKQAIPTKSLETKIKGLGLGIKTLERKNGQKYWEITGNSKKYHNELKALGCIYGFKSQKWFVLAK